MRQVKLKKMHVENFKGLKFFDIDFDDDITRVVGANGTGKTSLHDAYLWLLTGADSRQNSAFFVQPIDKDGSTVDRLLTVVSCVMSFGGEEHELKKVYEQKWTRRRGTKDDVLCGNTSSYFMDGVPQKMNEYYSAVAEYICGQDDFILLSSVYSFNDLDVKAKRAKLIQMAGTFPEIMNETDYPRLWKYWQNTQDVDAIKKTVNFELAGLRSEKEKIPVKISENERNLPEGICFDIVREELAIDKVKIAGIDAELQKKADDKSGLYAKVSQIAGQIRDVDSQINELISSTRGQRSKTENELLSEKSRAGIKVREIDSKVKIAEAELAQLNRQKSDLESKLQATREQWKAKNAETFSADVDTECPTCHRPFSEGELLEMRNELVRAFNESKASVIKAIVETGNDIAQRLFSTKSQITAKSEDLESLKKQLECAKSAEAEVSTRLSAIPSVEQALAASREYANLWERKKSLEEEAASAAPAETQDEAELRKRKETLSNRVEELLRQLALEANIEKVEKRRAELEAEDSRLSEDIAGLEGVLYEAQQYSKARINVVENIVSSKFKYVRWKMYEPNLTNDGEREICECLVEGVPVSKNVNTAAVVNAGIDIINALSEWLGVSAPLWIDGKESVSELIDTNAQLITLQVVENQPLSVA